MKTSWLVLASLGLAPTGLAAPDPLDRLDAGPATPFTVAGKGVVNDATHPVHPGSVRAIDASLKLALDPVAGVASIEIETGEGADKSTDRYYVRRGRVFQTDDKGLELAAEPLADVSAAAVAVMHPALVASALRENRPNLGLDSAGAYVLAVNDVLWSLAIDTRTSRIVRLRHREFGEVLGDGDEEVAFEYEPARVIVRKSGRETARFTLDAPVAAAAVDIPPGDSRRIRGHAIASSEIKFQELAPHLFTIDLASLNTRVTVAEFADFVMVIEGAYNARIGDLLARAIRERFTKPIRYFAFSHLHGQYIGSTRSYVAENAIIIVPPTTAPLIEELAKAPATLQPDALSKSPRAPTIETVKTSRLIEDASNAVKIFNVVSEHTDEYFVFWFPGPKILLTGDLLFYRPGKPLTGRSKRVCRTVAELGLQPARYVATWPLDGFDTRNIVSGEEMRAACAAALTP